MGRRAAPADAAATGDRARLPRGIRLLLVLSTGPWRGIGHLPAPVAAHVERLIGEGWTVRQAWHRNFVLWSGGRTLRHSRLPLVVLPYLGRSVEPRDAGIFVLGELLRAELRVAGDALDAGRRARYHAMAAELLGLAPDAAAARLPQALTDATRRVLTGGP